MALVEILDAMDARAPGFAQAGSTKSDATHFGQRQFDWPPSRPAAALDDPRYLNATAIEWERPGRGT